MENRVEYQSVVLSALLHDIGKFLQRGRPFSADIKGTLPELSGQFISAFADVLNPLTDIGLLNVLVIHHHQNKIKEITSDRTRNLAYLINKADILSSSEGEESAVKMRNSD
jgi:CRISPR/Cas system-associated protein Cas10 (large subunit of type III CRISPR-Cas system)